VSVSDDGVGVDSRRRGDGLGLRGIEERVKKVHGVMRIQSAPGQGTRLEIKLPLPARAVEEATLARAAG
jgi:two-component system sensor histidine kinase UhpB